MSRFELGAVLKRRLIQRIANLTVGSLISTLFIAGAGVGVGVVTAPMANAVLYAPVITSISTVGSNDLFVSFTDASTDTLQGYLYTTNSTNASPTWKSCVSSGSDCTWVSGAKNVTVKKLSTENNAARAGSTYQVAIRACTSKSGQDLVVASCGPISTTQSVTTGVPDAPTIGTPVAGNGQVTVPWSAPANNGGATISSYTVTASPGGATCTYTGSGSNSCTVTGLSNGTAYTFTVVATNSVGSSAASSASVSTTPVAVITTQDVGTITAPVTGATPQTSLDTTQYSGSISWSGSPATFAAATTYTATITLTPKSGYTLSGVVANFFTLNSGTTPTTRNSANAGSFTYQFPTTNAAPTVSTPTISGTQKVGSVLTASATSTGTPTPTISYQWFRSSTVGGTYSAISGATASTYTLVSADLNQYLKVQATASNGVSPNAVDTSTATAQIAAADVSYSVSSTTSSVGAGTTVTYGAADSTSQTTLTLTRSGNSGSDPQVTISVTGGSWTATQGTGTTISGTSATITSESPATITLTASTGTLTLSRNAGLTLTTETATVNSTSARTYAVTVEADTPDTPSVSETTTANVSFTVKWNRPTRIGSGALSSYTLTVSPAPSSGGPSFTITPSGGATESYTVNNLTNGTEYTFTITATNNGGKVSNAATTRGKPRTTPGAPGTPTVTTYDETATVTFAAPGSDGGDAVTTYTVYATPPSGSAIECTTSTTTCLVTGLSNGTTYTFTVKAENGAGKGSASSGRSAKPVVVPGQPSIVSVTPYNETATVAWAPPAKDGGDTITAYTVTATAGGVSKTCTATGTSCTVTGLTNGTTYSFTVKATNGQGNSAASSANTGKPSWVPKAPIAPTVTAYTDTATVSWSEPDNNGEAITSYTVESSTAGSGTWYTVLESTNLTSVEVSGLTGKSNLVFRVSATNSKGRGSNSDSSAPVTPGKSSHSITLNPSTTRANFGSNSGASITTSTSATDFDTFGSLNSSLSYSVSDTTVCQISSSTVVPKSGGKSGSCVVTVSSSGNSKYNGASNTFTFTVDPIEPDDPETSTVTTTSSSIVVNWNALASGRDGGNGGSGVKGYTLEYSTNSGSTWTPVVETGTVLTGTISSLSPDTNYLLRLKAVNNGNKTSAGRSFTAKTNAATKSARSLALSGGSGINFGQSLSLSKTGTDTGSTRWSTNDSSICTVDGSGNVTSVAAGICTVSFVADEDATYQSETATSTFTIEAINPDAPSLSDPAAGEESINLSWSAPTNRGGAASITGYTVTSSPAGFGCTTTGATTCTITGLNSSTTYTFTITATSSSGKTSVVSSSKSGKPNAKPVASTPRPEPAPRIDPGPTTPLTPREPTKAAPKTTTVLPPVKSVPAATPENPAKGNIETFKDGKKEVAVLTITQQPTVPTKANNPVQTASTKAEVKGTDWSMAVVATAAQGAVNAAPNAGGETEPAAAQIAFEKGASAQTTGTGFAPRTYISVYLFSDPIMIGKIRTDGNGNFKGSIKIPADIEVGNHTLQLNGYTKNLEVRTASLPVAVFAKQAAAAKPTPTPTPAQVAKISTTSFTITFGMNSWWVDSVGYNVIRAAVKKIPADAKGVTISVVGNKQQTNVDPYPNIGLDRAKAVVKAMRSLGIGGRYTAVQSDEQGLTTAEYRRADVTISWAKR